MYARGILFGKMKYELGDHSVVRCPENHLTADIEFKTKGWVSGTYNAIGGAIKNDKTGEVLYELSGLWSGEMFIKDVRTGQKKTLFDATHAKHAPPKARPIEEQDERESQRLWLPTVRAVHAVDHDTATTEKAKIEDRQREEAKRREEMNIDWQPKLFRRVQAGHGAPEEGEEDLEWIINANLDTNDPKELTDKILSIYPIVPGQKPSSEQAESKPSHTQQQTPQQSAQHAPQPASQPAAPPARQQVQQSAQHAPQPAAPPTRQQVQQPPRQQANLIDFDSRPSSAAPPEPARNVNPGAALPAQSSSQQVPLSQSTTVNPPKGSSLMDDDLSHDMSKMNMHTAMVPQGQKALKRADTDTNEVDTFVDAAED
ncbi:Oxysterol-binding protein OBPa [Elasticomyces elasticus]|uniref:Oxysterol-binding protein OBPa n=1 Tax=Exophiala sideris TaxID=1016849 RepID=A0ABR0IY72_9EURO|nr:Oxysterol-binding protein OBPa [Elasticomyces elasticus]KAK5022500.1 Oxysterol-binding protein OBPa [Exophiala sideris]KAK5028028.1 Oxysterol-binding protein OBPa [Exophiala sideris]KAK5051769.1 Oxysterol-binding protein OBPa [Exophiala sideris]KAK5177899.1 Oxysterol-binding protein OBPa [Eurotiomycetes sp. CCFEE 6388]